MATKSELEKGVSDFFDGNYEVTDGQVIPDLDDIRLGKFGRELKMAMLFIDIKESTTIVDGFRRVTGAKMYKSFLWGITKIARNNDGQLLSFNGDGVLVGFVGDLKRTDAVKTGMQMKWYGHKILRPKINEYFENNSELEDMKFDFGIGVDVGNILVVRGGIKGENNNDLVWVGNPTNFAVKLSKLASEPNNIYITQEVYDEMGATVKWQDNEKKKNMWTYRTWEEMDNLKVLSTTYHWSID
ncbi:MAG: hypothetical protein PHE68_02940 [Candidatus Peribacteraceae bacterium]|nr:hypothetical protein [Candidatus Peribacteraceae bacterium]MDD5074811.1 hypothetical protein [Candidatus Peribacteraceae bacterium]